MGGGERHQKIWGSYFSKKKPKICLKNKCILFSVCKIRLDLCYAITHSVKLLAKTENMTPKS